MEDAMELRQLTIFRAVARMLNFTKAATSLNYVQSNVTAQIHALEEEFGVPLFDRLGGKQVVLTEAGRQLLESQSACWTWQKKLRRRCG
jgi:DNA-binding transcriptional LysR family regulator